MLLNLLHSDNTYWFDINSRKIVDGPPLLLHEFLISYNYNSLQVLAPEATGPQGHQEIENANERRIGISKYTQHHMLIQVLQHFPVFVMRLKPKIY